MANQILAGAVVQAGMVIAGVDADNPPVTSSESSTPSLGDPFPHAGDIKATGAPSPFYAHYADANDWLTYGVFTDQPYGSVSNRPRIVPDGTPAGAIHFLRYDLDNEMLYAYASYATSGGIGQVLEDVGFGSGWGLFYSFWQNGGNNTGAAPMSSGYFMQALKKPMTEAEFDALEFYWDEDGGQSGQGSWRINPDVVTPTQPVPATSVTDASFYSGTASDGQEVVVHTRRDIAGQWVSYGLGEGWFGDQSNREKIIEDGTWTEGAIHYLRYDPISKRIWAFWSYEGTPGAYGTLEQYGFGGYSLDDENAFFNAYLSSNMTDFHFFPSGYFGKMIGSKEQYEVEDLEGLGISWNGTSWTKAVEATASPTNVIVGSMWSEGIGSGSAAIYDITTGDQTLRVTQPSAIQSQYANFGRIVAANSTKFAVGAPSEVINGNVQNGGEVIVYDIDGSNPVSILYADNLDTTSGDEFGDALAISDNYVWTGIWKGDTSGSPGRGQLTRHNFDGSLASVIDGPVNSANVFFGKQVAWSGSHIVCTAPGPNGLSSNYSDGYFAVYTEDGTLVETVFLAGSKGNLFGDRMNVTDASCTSNKVVLRDKNSKVYLYDLDAADIAGSMVMVANNPNATTLGLAVNDDYVYVGLSESGQTDTIKVYSHDGTHQFDITPSTEVLSGAGNPANHLQQFGANIEATNNHIFTTVTNSGDLVVLDASGNHVTSIDTNGGSYSGYWTGGVQFFA